MPYSAEEQRIYEWVRDSLPRWWTSAGRLEEDLAALVAVGEAVRAQIAHWREQAAILTATAPVGEPDWLNGHARDRDTHRADGESNDSLRARLRQFADALTLEALLSLINQMLDDAGVASNAYGIVELRRDRSYLVTRQRIQGTGTTLAKSGTTMTLTTATTFQGGLLRWDRGAAAPVITIAGATTPANNGDFAITGFDGDAGVTFENASGAAEAYAGTWTVNAATHNRRDSYIGRGYRMGSAGLVAILPFGTDEALRLAIAEAIRQRRAAGVTSRVERRLVP